MVPPSRSRRRTCRCLMGSGTLVGSGSGRSGAACFKGPGRVRFQEALTRTVGVVEGGFADLALQDHELVPQGEDLDVLAAVARRQQAQEREGVGRGEVGQTKEHDRS